MGNCLANIFRRRNRRRHIILILIGLDNAGKTKTVNNLVGDRDDKLLPTVGFKAVNLVHKDTPVTIYDLGGGPEFRQIWQQYYSEVHGVIFVIDSSDLSRLEECKTVLEEVLSHDKIAGKPCLILANKQDKNGALDDIDVVDSLNIEPLVNRYRCPTLVESYSAEGLESKGRKPKIDPGLRKGYQWLLNYIVKRYGDLNLRVQTDIHVELERRKRMLVRGSRASQTFTAVSDGIATQTGFENPNYQLPQEAAIKDGGLIMVKPTKPNNNSVDTTLTMDSGDSDNTSNVKTKVLHSPLFGQSQTSSTTETVRIELEQRSEFRKLSPIVRKKSSNTQPIDFIDQPQSSPFKKHGTKVEPLKKLSSREEFNNSGLKTDAGDLTMYLGDGNRTWDAADQKRRAVTDVDISMVHREIKLTERDYCNKTASSDIIPAGSGGGSTTLPLTTRPASASQLVRKQLELSHHKRRNSLRYMNRNKTSPDRVSMLIYEPKQRQHDKGDFHQTAAIN